MWEHLLKPQHPIILQWWNIPVLLWIKARQECLSCVNNKLLHTSLFADCRDKLDNIIPGINVVDSKAAFNSNWNVYLLDHRLADLGDKFWIKHELSSKAPIYCLVTWASTIEIDLVIAPLFYDLRSHSNFERVIATNLANYRMLIIRKV